MSVSGSVNRLKSVGAYQYSESSHVFSEKQMEGETSSGITSGCSVGNVMTPSNSRPVPQFHAQELITIGEDGMSASPTVGVQLRADKLKKLDELTAKTSGDYCDSQYPRAHNAWNDILVLEQKKICTPSDLSSTKAVEAGRAGSVIDEKQPKNLDSKRQKSTSKEELGETSKATDSACVKGFLATSENALEPKYKKKICAIIALTVVIIVGVVIIFFAVGMNKDQSKGNPGAERGAESKSPVITSSSRGSIKEFLIQTLLETDFENSVLIPNSAQHKALKWLVEIDKINLDSLSKERLVQRYILLVLYFSTNGEQWTKPFVEESKHECEWTGVECEVGKDTILILDLKQRNMKGPVPEEIGWLSNLEKLSLENNALTGTIPEKLHQLQGLQWFDASSNQMTGTIPHNLWTLPFLRFVFLSENQFSGPIWNRPDDVENETVESTRFLQQIWLHRNALTGTIPKWIHELELLQQLLLYENRLTGTLSEFASTYLEFVNLSSNSFEGKVPATLLRHSTYLYLHNNSFSGKLPQELSATVETSKLQKLWLNSNQFSGSIPETFGQNWNALTELTLHDNEFLIGRVSCSILQHVESIEVDCQVECDCCNQCY